MLLDSNKQHKEITKKQRHNRIDKTQRKRQQGRTKTKWANKKLPTYKTVYRIIQKTPNAEIPKWNFPLLSNPLVLFHRIFRG
jgi:phage/plasmid-associated DNA primase